MNPETRNCQNCKNPFVIESEDFDFYTKIAVPPPTWCPQCRLMRRLAWRNERALYKRTCDMCKEAIVAMYPAGTPFPVYCKDCWYSDKWDATAYGREYDFSRTFFDQFHDLIQAVPQIALQVSTSPGSEYVNQVANCKNCYLVVSGSDNEDCMYCHRILDSKNVIDFAFGRLMESSYQCTFCLTSSDLLFADDCIDSLGLRFCVGVYGSQECFMSSNLRHASYAFRNNKMTKEEYAAQMKAIDIGSYRNVQAYLAEFEEMRTNSLRRYMIGKNSPNSSGHAVANCTDTKYAFNALNTERCKYCVLIADMRDVYDTNNGCCQMELAYECSTAGVNTYNTKLSADVWPDVRNTTYSQSCRNDVSDLFGCVSIRKKQYCILNKQYTKEEYGALVPKIIAQMNEKPHRDSQGRAYPYGEFFPPEMSLYAYNESPAQDYFPKTRTEVEAMGFRWREPDKRHYDVTIPAQDLPDHIRDVGDNITQQVVGCAHGGACTHQCPGAFRITPQELQFYRQKNISLPRLCPNCRHYERFALINPYRLWKRRCQCGGSASLGGKRNNVASHPHGAAPCSVEFETSYAPERPEIVYCESCYNAEVA